MKRLVVQIDGGYLRAVCHLNNVTYDVTAIQKIVQKVVQKDREDLIRAMYYDAPHFSGTKPLPISGNNKEFSPNNKWLDDLAAREFFAVRRGTVKFRGWKVRKPEALTGPPCDDDYDPDFQQKGVDLRIGVDMVTYAYEKSADRIVIIAGDTDFIPAMKIARRRGIQVVGTQLPKNKLSQEFLHQVDLVRSIDFNGLSLYKAPLTPLAVHRG